jgi:Tfp pilus assembly protein PilN
LNLLPAEHRQTSSPLLWVPSAALGALVLLLAGALAALPSFENRRYMQSLTAEMAKLQPVVARSAAIDKQIETARQRIALLDDLRRRPKADMDVLAELTKLLPPPTWLNLMELNARQVTVGGETDQAAPLLKTLDASSFFEASEFAMPPLRIAPQAGLGGVMTPGGEGFRIRTNREAQRP